MTKIQRSKLPTVPQLLNHIFENANLLAGVRELPGPALGQLIRRVGLEDAAELVALATTEQLEQVFDEDLWQAGEGGTLEQFDPARFALWLHAFSEAGEDAVVKRLMELPLDLVTLAIHRLILVIDIEALAVEMSSSGRDLDQLEKALDCCLYEEWEEFRLISRDDTVWDEICQALFALDRDHHTLLRRILEHCAAMSAEWIEDNGGLYDVLTSDEMLEHDVRGDRDDRRARRGYVSAADAKAFLALAHRGSGDENTRDPLTKAYFRELARISAQPRSSSRSQTRNRGFDDGAALMALLTRAHVLDASDYSTKGTPAARELPSKSRRRNRVSSLESAAVTVTTHDASTTSLLERALRVLRETDAQLYELRMEELGYLANVLVSAPKRDRQRLRPIEALEAAVAVVNIAIERQVAERAPQSSAESSVVTQTILRTTTLDCLFRSVYPSLCANTNTLAPILERLRRVLADMAPPSRTAACDT